MAYSQFRTPRDDLGSILDTNGEPLYLVEYDGLLHTIIRRNDVVNLKSYIEQYPESILHNYGITHHDPFRIAAACGSTDVLRVLLDLYEADPAQTQRLNKGTRGFSVLDIACEYGHLETAKMLLDRDPPLGKSYTEDRDGGLALLSAGKSLARAGSYQLEKKDLDDDKIYLLDRVARSEELIRLLLDRGASIRNAFQTLDSMRQEPKVHNGLPQNAVQERQYQRVLGRVVSRASYDLVSCLITESADIYKRQELMSKESIQNVIPLHIASGFWNVPAIQALFDNSNSRAAKMVSVCDGDGRLPLHWAAMGAEMGHETTDEYFISEEELSSRILETLKLLIDNNDPDTINAYDQQSMTALHYLVRGHRFCGDKGHLEQAVRLLCENGLDAGLYNTLGQTALHELGVSWNPISPVVLEIMIAHGASTTINHVNSNGKTALHKMAWNLKQVEPVRVIIRHGADTNALTREGNTPLHEAAVGNLVATVLINEGVGPEHVYPTLIDKIKAQDEMIAVLQEAGCSMDQPNGEGKTPRQLLVETRAKWRRIEDSKGKPCTRGRGRG